MKANRYQEEASTTALYMVGSEQLCFSDDDDRIVSFLNLAYCALKLNGEAGEVAELIGKALRDDKGKIDDGRLNGIVMECGDVLWYIAMILNELDVPMEECMKLNLSKLKSRADRDKLHGDGDYR